MIVDAHMHIWSEIKGQIGGKIPVVPLGNGMIRIGENSLLGMPATHLDCSARAEWALSEFDAAGVDVGVIVQEFMDGEQNDYVLKATQKSPGRWIVHGLPNYWKKDSVGQEAAELLDRGFDGIKLPGGHLAMAGLALDDPKLIPVYEKIAAKSRVLAVDCCEGEGQIPALENILKRFPKLKIAIGHFGMPNRKGWPGQLRLCRHENVYLETGGIIWLYRHEGYPFPGAIAAIHQAKKEVGIEKLMWGSDWPRTMVDFTYRQSLDFIRVSDKTFSDREKQLLLGENAARLYGIQSPAQQQKPVALITEG
jgi:hypothetical protein